jgi:hypothetical protein
MSYKVLNKISKIITKVYIKVIFSLILKDLKEKSLTLY